MEKYEVLTTETVEWQYKYSIKWLPWKVINCRDWEKDLWFLWVNWFIVLNDTPKNKFTLYVTVEL